MAPQSSDATRLLIEAARAGTLTEQQRLMGEAMDVRGAITAQAAQDRAVDLAQAVVSERLTPVPVHEHHTAATDWLGDVDTTPPANAEREMVAQGSVWYAQVHEAVKQHPDELVQQALGMARRLAGRYGRAADAAERAFLDHVGSLHDRDVSQGLLVVAAADQTTEGPGVQGGQVTMGLPGDMTSSNRAPQMRELSNNTSGGDNAGWPSPLELPQQDVDAANGDAGTSRVASQHQADMIDSPWTREMGKMIFGDEPRGNDMRPSGQPIIDDQGPHVYHVTTSHEPASGGQVTMDHQIRSSLPDAHYEAEEAAASDHASHHGVPDNAVEIASPARLPGEGPGHYGAKAPYRSEDAGTGVQEQQLQAQPKDSDEDDGHDHRDHPDWQRHHNAKGTPMQQRTAACPECRGCPACGGTHRVAVRAPRTAASGLDQVDQTIDPHDNPKATPYPTDVAFPWEMPNDSGQAIQETEQQLAEREQRKGASRRQLAEHAARQAAANAYRRVLAGQDDSGWAGDMGQGGVRPGMQDTGNPGVPYPGNLADADPVYGQGGDNGNQPLKPYGADEADDVTNNPGMGYQPGQPTQYDQAGRPNQVGQPTAARRPSDDDPEIARAQTYIRQRRAILDRQS